jgi:hypothetical protein
MANFFDQYDPPPAKGNFFDQYDDRAAKGGMFSDVIPEIKNAAGSAIDAMSKLSDRGKQGPLEGMLTTGRAALAVPELLASPITGAARSLLGHPIAAAETAVGGLINPKVAAERDASGSAYEDAKTSVDTALSAMGTRGGPIAAAAAPAAARPVAPVVEAAQRLSGVVGDDINVPRAIATDSMAAQRAGQGIRNLPIVGDAIPKATNQLVESLGDATKSVADQYGSGSGPNVANRIGQTIQGAADAETGAATDVARRSDDTVLAAWQRDVDTAHQDVAGREANSLQAARAAVGDMSPQDMGATLIERLRTNEATARAQKERLYDVAGASDASIHAAEVRNVRARVAQGLENEGIIVDPGTAAAPSITPAANRMMNVLQDLAELRIGNSAVGARTPATGAETPVAVSAQGLEQARKRLVFARSGATNNADRRAATHIMREFNEWQSHAFENALYSGSAEALDAFRAARSANTDWMNRFFNEDDDAGRVITSIATGERTPQEVANYIIGAGQVGAKGVSSRLLTRIAEATNDDPEALQAIQGGVWNRLSQATEGADPKASAKVTRDIIEFLNGSGRDVAQRLFTPDQQRMMRAYADTLRSGQDARALIGDVASATKPGSMDVPAGPMKQLADAVIGKGGKSDEALFRAIDGYAKSGNRADVVTLAKLVKAIPQDLRTDLAGSIIRNIGISPRTGEFSPDVFVSQWNNYTPQAKTVLFGNAGPQRQAIDDIAIISDRLKQVGSKFGNPSGTAQTANFGAGWAAVGGAVVRAFSGDFVTPLALLTSAVGGGIVAKILAAPAGAASAAKWSKAYATLLTKPSPQAVGLFQAVSRNLANTAQGLGAKVSAEDLVRAIQGGASTPQTQQQ